MKGKKIGKKDINTMTAQRKKSREEKTEVLGVKPPRDPPSGNRSTRQSVGIHGLARDPLKPNLPAIPKPSKLLLQQSFSESCLV